jgi:hypothetical protein
MNLASVFFFSLSTLGIEVLLARIFAISQWHYLAFMVISLVLFGFSAGGTVLSLVNARRNKRAGSALSPNTLISLTALYGISVIGGFWLLNQLPLDYFQLPLDPLQIVYLMVTYSLLALPFFAAGVVLAAGFAAQPTITGLVYATAMTGSALGALIPAVLLPFMGEIHLLVTLALVPLAGLPWYVRGIMDATAGRATGLRFSIGISTGLCLALALIGAGLLATGPPALMRITATPYKALVQMLQFPESHVEAVYNGIRGRLTVVESPHVRFAPGLSLKFTGRLPRQQAVYLDGDRPLTVHDGDIGAAITYTDFLLSNAAYRSLANPDPVLIIQRGGGAAIPAALGAGASDITVIESHPRLARLLDRHYPVKVVCAVPRAFLAQHRHRYGLIHVENWGYSLPGTAALSPEYDLTLEAVAAYLAHLKADGAVMFTRKILLPERDLPRLWATVYEALRGQNRQFPERHIAVLRSWGTYVLIAFARPLEDTRPLRAFARRRNFDLVFLPGLVPEEANRYNIFAKPYHYTAVQNLWQAYVKGEADDFFQTHPLDIAPLSDSRPFYNRFLKWTRIQAVYESTGKRFYTLMMSGEMVIAAVFAQSLLVAVLLLGLPALLLRRVDSALDHCGFGYFFAVGAGFILVEMFLINWYTLLFDNPLIGFTIVLAGLLIFSGLGGLWSLKLDKAALSWVFPAILSLLVAVLVLDQWLLEAALRFSLPGRCTAALLIMLPVGVLMGIPFSIGLRDLAANHHQRTYAWSINGCASVLLSIASAQLALSLGLDSILAAAAIAYALAYGCQYGMPRKQILFRR